MSAAIHKLIDLLKRHRYDLLWASGSALASVAITVWALHLWQANLRVPFIYGGDGLGNLFLVKSVLQNGWYQVNPYVGAPFGLELYDYPSVAGDHLNILIIKALGIFSSNPPVVENGFFLLSVPMCALSAYSVQRYYKISMPVAFVTSILFALTPDHFIRGEGHLFLAAAWTVPLGCYFIIESIAGRPLFTKRAHSGSGVLSYASTRSITTLILAVVIATTGTYYAVFTIVLMTVGALIAAIGARRIKTLISPTLAATVVLLTLVTNLAPTLIYQKQHGDNPVVGQRQPFETDLYGLKISDMLLPVTNHRVKALAEIRQQYDGTRIPRPNVFFSEMGTAAGAGFIFLLLTLLVTVVAPARAPANSLPRQLATAAFLALLLATIGGFASILAYAFTPQIREWSRISILIVFLSLLALAVLLDRGAGLLSRLRKGRIVSIFALAAVLVLAILDTHNPPAVFTLYKSNEDAYVSDSRFVDHITRQVGDNASIYQMPYMSFPENGPVSKMPDYEPLRGYLHSDKLRWSYPAMKGRVTDWAERLKSKPTRQVVAAVAAAGFKGIWIDRNGYRDRGAEIEAQLKRLVDSSPLRSDDRTFLFFNLSDYIRAMRDKHPKQQIAAARAATLYPLTLEFKKGFYPADLVEKRQFHWARNKAAVEFSNPAGRSQQATFSAVVATGTKKAATVTLRWPDGVLQRLPVSSQGSKIKRKFKLKPGMNKLLISTGAARAPGDPRDLHVAIIDPSLRNPAFAFAIK